MIIILLTDFAETLIYFEKRYCIILRHSDVSMT